jgi:catalase
MESLKSAAGRPIVHNENTLSLGPRGPVLLQDYVLLEKLAHFNRERIPERVVHAKGSAAYGIFKLTNDISKFSKANLFSEIGKETKVLVRFSTVGGEKGSADTERDPRGFAIKFYTNDGNWDLVGNNTPIFFIKDPKKFPDFIHSQKRDPQTNLKSPTMMWDYWSLNPESVHQVLFLFTDRGTPKGYRYMNGYGSHTFTLINKEAKKTYVKFHLKTQQGNKTFTDTEAAQMKAQDLDYAQRDLFDAIVRKDFPVWKLMVQTMSVEEAKTFRYNPFDLTKIWPHAEFPLIEIGSLELNQNPINYFNEVEQAAFSPSNLVDGIGFSPDKMLQGRILAYPDAQRYRLGVNYNHIPVNACPYGSNNYMRDGHMNTLSFQENSPNYFPNSFDGPQIDASYSEIPENIDQNIADYYDRNAPGENDHYSQPGEFWRRVLNPEEKANTICNIVESMRKIDGPKRMDILFRQLCHWFRVDISLGMSVAKGLGLDDAALTSAMPKEHGV